MRRLGVRSFPPSTDSISTTSFMAGRPGKGQPALPTGLRFYPASIMACVPMEYMASLMARKYWGTSSFTVLFS